MSGADSLQGAAVQAAVGQVTLNRVLHLQQSQVQTLMGALPGAAVGPPVTMDGLDDVAIQAAAEQAMAAVPSPLGQNVDVAV